MQRRDAGVRFVRRKLFAMSAAYLTGIYLTEWICIPENLMIVISALCVGAGVFLLRRRKSALFCVMLMLFLIGNGRTARELGVRDSATQPGVYIEGTVVRKEDDLRVVLSGVCVDGGYTPARDVVVTLMLEEDESGAPVEERRVYIGQQVAGTGRLFEPEAIRNPGGIDGRVLALCDGYELSGYILPGWTAQGVPGFSLREVFRRAKAALSGRIALLFGESAPLFQAMLIGDRKQVGQETIQSMRLSGIAHLLTISGMHLTMIAYALAALLKKLPVGRRCGFALQTIVVAGFTCITGGAAGTVRACVMAVMKALASLTGRRYDPLTALAAAAFLMTLFKPVWALNASFQFSFFVVLGVHLLNRQVFSALRRLLGQSALGKRTAGTVAVSLSAQISALPMQLALYGYIPLLALPVNLVCGALMPVMMLGGWSVVLISFALPKTAALVAEGVSIGALAIEQISAAAAAQEWAIIRLPAPYRWTLVLAAMLLVAASRQIPIRRGRRVVCLMLSAALAAAYLPRFDPSPRYVQLDVGQGDGALLRKGRKAVLIDVGPADEYAMLRYLRHEGLSVDTVILSHLDEDHAGALGVLLESEIEVLRVVMPEDAQEEAASQAVRDALVLARQMGVSIETAERGETIETGVCAFDVLSPGEELSGSNERSLVLWADFDGMRILTLGDLPLESEADRYPACDVLKVAHHGSRYATSRALIEESYPAVALISVGDNNYGHPSDRVLEDLRRIGAQVYRTDQSGCLTVRAEQGVCSVHTFMK